MGGGLYVRTEGRKSKRGRVDGVEAVSEEGPVPLADAPGQARSCIL